MGESNNKRIAKNAIMLTIRTIFATVVGLYTSRVVLAVLGVEDYGIYGVVGGLTGMMSFLNASMAGATSRFLSYELGRGDERKLNQTFSSSVMVHMLIALVVVIIAESVGVWFLNEKMNIPTNRMFAANWVLQFSIISTAFSIIQTPYNALIIAHERMGIYAYVEMANACLKLAVVFLLVITDFDKLIFYTGLLLIISALTSLAYFWFCIRNYKESHFHLEKDMSVLKKLLVFSGLDLYGNMSAVACNQGRSIIINIFFGVVYNAAVSIALVVQGTIMGLTAVVVQAFRPQIIKQYACNNIAEMQSLLSNTVKFTLIAMAAMCIPCFLFADVVLDLWLGTIPPYAVSFLKVLLISALFQVLNNICNIAIHATGNIKYISFITGTIFLLNPFVAWGLFKLGFGAIYAYVILIISYFTAIVLAFGFIRKLIPSFNIRAFGLQCMKAATVVLAACIFSALMSHYVTGNLIGLIFIILFNSAILSTISWMCLLNAEERVRFKHLVLNKISRFKAH